MNYLNLSELHSFQLRNGAIIYQIDPGIGDGQTGRPDSWGRKESDRTQWLK